MDTENLNSDASLQAGPGLHTQLFSPHNSGYQKYREMVVGDRGLLALLWFELLTTFLGPIPGALGLFLRRIFYPTLFKSVGKDVVFGRNLTLRHPHKISIGSHVIIDEDCTLDAKGESNQGLTLGDYVTIGRWSSLVCKNGDIEIGSHVNIGTTVKIIVNEGGLIRIGSNIDIGSLAHFSGGTYDYDQLETLPSARKKETLGITVEDFAWIGVGVILLDGVCIGKKSIVGAGAVVTSDIPPHSVAVGVPARVIKKRI